MITELLRISSLCIRRLSVSLDAHAGTAGEILLFSDALGLRAVWSSLSRRFFSLETILREAMLRRMSEEANGSKHERCTREARKVAPLWLGIFHRKGPQSHIPSKPFDASVHELLRLVRRS